MLCGSNPSIARVAFCVIFLVLFGVNFSPAVADPASSIFSRSNNLGLPHRGSSFTHNVGGQSSRYHQSRIATNQDVSTSPNHRQPFYTVNRQHRQRNHMLNYQSRPSHALFSGNNNRHFQSSSTGRKGGSQRTSNRNILGDIGSGEKDLGKLDAILTQLENTNEKLLQELRHERQDLVASHRNHSFSRHRNHQQRHSSASQGRPAHHHSRPRGHHQQPRHQGAAPYGAGSPLLSPVIDLDPFGRNSGAGTAEQSRRLHGSSATNYRVTDDDVLHTDYFTQEISLRPGIGHSDHIRRRSSQTSQNIIQSSGTSRGSSSTINREDNAGFYRDKSGFSRDFDDSSDDLQATRLEDLDYQDEQATQQRTKSSMQHHLKERDAQSLKLASDNVRYVMTNAQCSLPVRRCLDLSVNETIIGKKYWPRCAIVSRCGEESGCCYATNHICTVAEYHVIDLYFYYLTAVAGRAGVDRLSFENHTKCECRPRPLPVVAALPPPPPVAMPSPVAHNTPVSVTSETIVDAGDDVSNDQPNSYVNTIDSKDQYLHSETDSIENTYSAAPLRQDISAYNSNRQNSYNNNRYDQYNSNVNNIKPIEHNYIGINSNRYKSNNIMPEASSKYSSAKYHSGNDNSYIKSISSSDAGELTKNAAVETTEISTSTTVTSPGPLVCKCPDIYEPVSLPSVPGACECECDVDRGSCRRIMKGKRYFKPKDEACILSGECALPNCKFGRFLDQFKRCPRKREMRAKRNRGRSGKR